MAENSFPDEANIGFEPKVESQHLNELQESKNELIARVANLKEELADWRSKMDSQVKKYRDELGDLRTTLTSEVDNLRGEFQELRATLKSQLETTSALVAQERVSDDIRPPPPQENSEA